jgi:predicted metalloprotease
MGPFYCPADQKVYIDLSFYDDLRTRFGAPGEFAEAYVLTHEIGHHVQHLLGTDAAVRRAQQAHPAQANALSVALELQADCYSGIWAHYTAGQRILEPGDIEQGLAAASAVGDDRLQRAATGHVDVDSFTHGSSAERVAWFRRGFESGDPNDCDTFASFGGR